MSCWLLVSFISPSGSRGTFSPISPVHLSLCLSVSYTARVCGASRGPRRFTQRGNKAGMTVWWHLLLCIISFYQSSAFHLCEARHSDTVCQTRWPSSVESEFYWVKRKLMKHSCPSLADSPRTPNECGKASCYSIFQQIRKLCDNIPGYPLLLLLLLLLLSLVVMIMPGVLFQQPGLLWFLLL